MASLSEATSVSLPAGISRCREPLSLKSNALWTIAGNGIYAGSQWMLITITAHLGTSADVGRYALALGYCTPVFMLFNLQLRTIQATDAARRYSFGEYLALRLVTSLAALLSLVIFACFYSNSAEAALLTAILAAFKCFESISDIYQGFLQQHERMDYVARSLMLKGLLVLITFGTTYFCTGSLLWAASVMAISQLVTLAYYDMRAATGVSKNLGATEWRDLLRRIERPRWDLKMLRTLAIHALPLGVTMMLGSLYTNVPRFVLDRYVGASGLGIFVAINYLSTIGSMLVIAVGTAVCPRLSQYAQSDKKAFRSLLSRLAIFAVMLGVLGTIAGSLIGRYLLFWLYGSEYACYTTLLVWSMAAAALMYVSSVLGFGATALGRLAGQPWAVALSIAVLLGSSLILVPVYGLVGAAIATLLSSSIWLFTFMSLVFWRSNGY